MQQLVPLPALLSEGDCYSVRSYLRNWLHRHNSFAEVSDLLDSTLLGGELGLDSLTLMEFIQEVENFYGTPILPKQVAALATVHDLEEALCCQSATTGS